MLNINNAYLTVFETENKEKVIKGRVSSSRKDQNDEYVNSYWNAIFLGKAKDKAAEIEGRTRIHVTSAGICNEPYTTAEGEKKYYVTLKIFDFESPDGSGDSKKEEKKSTKGRKSSKKNVVEDDDDVPF